MFNKYIFTIALGLALIGSIALKAQKVALYTYQLGHPIKLKPGKIYIKPLTNKGDKTSIDVNAYLLETFTYCFEPIGDADKDNPNVWSKQIWFQQTDQISEAQVVISGSYQISAKTEVEQYQFYESNTALANPIPYFEVRPKNKVDAEIIISYQYADKSMDYDTIRYSDESERKAGRKMKSLASMIETCDKNLKYEIERTIYWVDYVEAKYELEKVKISDKALKEEFKSASDLFKNKEIMKLGNLCKRIYETCPSKEAAFNLGVCYEWVGNYPQATKYYKQMPEFHTIARMKKCLIFFDYIHELGIETELVEF